MVCDVHDRGGTAGFVFVGISDNLTGKAGELGFIYLNPVKGLCKFQILLNGRDFVVDPFALLLQVLKPGFVDADALVQANDNVFELFQSNAPQMCLFFNICFKACQQKKIYGFLDLPVNRRSLYKSKELYRGEPILCKHA